MLPTVYGELLKYRMRGVSSSFNFWPIVKVRKQPLIYNLLGSISDLKAFHTLSQTMLQGAVSSDFPSRRSISKSLINTRAGLFPRLHKNTKKKRVVNE